MDKVIEEGEKILWQGNPNFWPFCISAITGSFLFGIPFLVMGFFVFLDGIRTGDIVAIIFPHFWIGFLMTFGGPLYKVLVYKHTHYAITNKRVLFQSGLIGRDFQMVDFDQVTNADVNVGLIDKLFSKSSGSILIASAGTLTYTRQGQVQKPYTLSHIKDPYEVFKFFKKVSHDVKTDIQYPNEYRPQNNPGYKSGYDPNQNQKQ